LGTARGERLLAVGAFDVPLADAEQTWRTALPRAVAG
jgi:hypothetical protein